MEDFQVQRKYTSQDIKPGHTIAVTKTVVVERVLWSNTGRAGIRGRDGNTYAFLESEWAFVTPKSWPPLPGDMWGAGERRYAAIMKRDDIALVPVDGQPVTLYSSSWDDFLAFHPVLVYRG